MAGKLGAGGAAKRKTGTKASPAAQAAAPTPGVGDNSDRFRGEEAKFLSILGKVQDVERRIDSKMAEVKILRDERAEIMNYASAAGFKARELKDILADMKVKGSRKNLREEEARRSRFRRYVGLPVGNDDEQLQLVPEEARDEIDWELEGYRSGVRAEKPEPPKECPQRFVQAWMKGYHDGQARNVWALKETAPKEEAAGGDGFEMSQAELDKQAGRKKDHEGDDDDPRLADPENTRPRRSVIAGYDIREERPDVFLVVTPEGVDLAQEHGTPDAAWDAADAHHDANGAANEGGETV